MVMTIDDVLDMLHRTGPDLVGGNSNHAPIVAEALFALGRPDAVMPWIERYKSRFQDRPQSRSPILREGWQALGASLSWGMPPEATSSRLPQGRLWPAQRGSQMSR
jgi:hypothetical protein